MATIHETSIPWNAGEEHLHNLLKVPSRDNPTSPFLTPAAAALLTKVPLLALGTIDEQHRPWTTLLGGEAGFAGPIGESVIGIRTTVDLVNDPVIQALINGKVDGEVVQHEGRGKLLSGLAIHLDARRRVKLGGRMLAGALDKKEEGVGEIQLAVRIEESLGNCPKYLNRRQIIPRIPKSRLISDTLPLSQEALDLVTKADLFFISSSDHEMSMDTNYRGGPPGFVRVVSNTEEDCTLVYPEYSGNRLYQTLGNLQVSPLAGVVIPDLETGNVLYLTVRTEVLAGQDAKSYQPRSNLAVKFHIAGARFVEKGLAFTAETGEFSPYNPPVQYLPSESKHALGSSVNSQLKAQFLKREILAPSIARFTFGLSEGTKWTPGQYVALDFSDELDIGYSHMRDDDPTSLNDDFVRTFTISNAPVSEEKRRLEITIKNVGRVTNHLFHLNERAGPFEVPIRGIEGDFEIKKDEGRRVGFIAGGVGITPLLSHNGYINYEDLILFWNVKVADLGLVVDTFKNMPGLAKSTKLFVTGDTSAEKKTLENLKEDCLCVSERRMAMADVEIASVGSLARWYVCTSPAFRQSLIEWLPGQEILYEDFNY